MKATLSNYKQSPRKTRLVADLMRGKSIAEAERALLFLPKKSAPAFKKLLASAVSSARAAGHSAESLVVKTITVNKGSVLRRFKPMARGRAARFHRTMSIIALELGEKGQNKKQKTKNKKLKPEDL